MLDPHYQVTYAAHDAWASRQTLIALVGPQLQRQQQEPESRVPLQHADAVHGPASPDASSPIAVAPADETTQLQSQDLQSPATQKPKPSSQPDKILSTTRKPKSEPLYDFLAPFVLKTSSSGVDSGHTGARGTWMQQRLQRNMKQQPAQSEQAKQQQVIMQDRGTRHTRLTAAAGTMAANLPGDSSTRSHELSLSEAHSQGGGPSLLSPMKVSGGRRKEVKALGKQPVLYDNCSIQVRETLARNTCSLHSEKPCRPHSMHLLHDNVHNARVSHSGPRAGPNRLTKFAASASDDTLNSFSNRSPRPWAREMPMCIVGLGVLVTTCQGVAACLPGLQHN